MRVLSRLSLPLAAAIIVMSSTVATTSDAAADLLLSGGAVVTLDDQRPRAGAVAIRDGRILAVGAAEELARMAGPTTRRIDTTGQIVLAGFTDAHAHVESLGRSLEVLDLVGTASLAEVLARVGAAAAERPGNEWLVGRGWDQNDWPEPRFPTAGDLDAVVGERPVLLTRVDGHAGWANTLALTLAGVSTATLDPPGGRVVRDTDGRPTGILIDAALELIMQKMPDPAPDVRRRRLLAGLAACARVGITSVHDAGIDLATLGAYKRLLAEGRLSVRVYAMVEGPEDFLGAGAGLRPEIGLGDGMLTVRSVKVVADGALGSRGALLLEPYSDASGERGLLTVDGAAFREVLRQALARGFQVCTHAIGDGANRFVLDAYEAGFSGAGGGRHRFRVEHAQVVSPEDVPRFRALGVIPSMQPTHCTSDMYWAGDRLGPRRIEGAYLWRTFLDQGLRIAGGSDAPVESIAVLPGLYAAVTRQDPRGWPEEGFEPHERVTLLEALAMFTTGAAFAAFEEDERGTITPGKRADLTILDRDITRLPPEDLLQANVVATIVGGRVVYARPAQD